MSEPTDCRTIEDREAAEEYDRALADLKAHPPDPYDEAERDAAAYLRRHGDVLGVRLVFHRRTVYLRRSGASIVLVTAGDGGLLRRIPLD